MREFNAAPNGYPHLLIGRLMVLYIVRSWYSHPQQDFKLETNMHLGSDHKSASASKDWLQPQTWLACRRTISNKKGHMQEDKSCRSQPCPSWPNRTWSRFDASILGKLTQGPRKMTHTCQLKICQPYPTCCHWLQRSSRLARSSHGLAGHLRNEKPSVKIFVWSAEKTGH